MSKEAKESQTKVVKHRAAKLAHSKWVNQKSGKVH